MNTLNCKIYYTTFFNIFRALLALRKAISGVLKKLDKRHGGLRQRAVYDRYVHHTIDGIIYQP